MSVDPHFVSYFPYFLSGEQQKAKHGPYHPDYLDTLQYLADYYLQCTRLNDAEPILIECLEGRKFALGAQHMDTVHTMDTLANLYDVTGTIFARLVYLSWYGSVFMCGSR